MVLQQTLQCTDCILYILLKFFSLLGRLLLCRGYTIISQSTRTHPVIIAENPNFTYIAFKKSAVLGAVPLEYQGGAWEQVALKLMQESPAKKRIGDILLCTPVELAIFTWRIIREKGCRCVDRIYPAAMSYSFNSSLIWAATRRAKPKAECYYSRGVINEEGVSGWRQKKILITLIC